MEEARGGDGRVRLAVAFGSRAEHEAWLAAHARDGTPEVWLVDLEHGWLQRYRAAAAGRYRRRDLHYPGDAVPLPGPPSDAPTFIVPEPVAARSWTPPAST